MGLVGGVGRGGRWVPAGGEDKGGFGEVCVHALGRYQVMVLLPDH